MRHFLPPPFVLVLVHLLVLDPMAWFRARGRRGSRCQCMRKNERRLSMNLGWLGVPPSGGSNGLDRLKPGLQAARSCMVPMRDYKTLKAFHVPVLNSAWLGGRCDCPVFDFLPLKILPDFLRQSFHDRVMRII